MNNPQKLKGAIANPTVPCWMIEEDPVEVIFHE